MEKTIVLIDAGFLSKVSRKLGEGHYFKYDLVKFAKNLTGKTVSCWYRETFHPRGVSAFFHPGGGFKQTTIPYTCDGLEIFQASWKIFQNIWNKEKIRMIGVSMSNLKSKTPCNLNFFQNEVINQVLDQVNNKFGEFTLQRAILLNSTSISRKPNSYLSDRRFKI